MFVIDENEKRLIPVGRVSEVFVNLLYQQFSRSDVFRRVLRIGIGEFFIVLSDSRNEVSICIKIIRVKFFEEKFEILIIDEFILLLS